ncbi:DEAD/DEAH box helicase family protein [Mycoplasma sp. SG1]|uniref:DEAD/DEAH box helicase family protein n=1 Tax=Mycoplasma sp. SG1 TaxID=2810348 RepID=UPI002024A538|nr:DEAD/DEAH box helicase family protein [Mycoplasma sp. SG1]URM52996.1 DEAD/DEAH box helicase family protein [Mycoplasma sp. SG1]
MILTEAQEWAVSDIVNRYRNNLKEISFKAPTASGKTFMIANVISRLSKIITDNGDKFLCICATITDAGLPRQMEENFRDYQIYLDRTIGNLFEIKHYVSPSISNANKSKNDADVRVDPIENGVLIFGKSSFGKDRIFTERDVIKQLVDKIKIANWKLIYIRDEAHLGGNKLPKENLFINQHFESILQENADFVILMTATPKTSSEHLIEINLNKLIKPSDGKFLIKTDSKLDRGISKDIKEIEDFEYFKQAIQYFKKKVQPAYKKDPALKDIRPCVLIQVDNSSANPGKKETWETEFAKVTAYLKNELATAVYFGEEKYSLNIKEDCDERALSKNDSLYDCVVFKVALAKGWNIPRACMLIQLRDLSSSALNIQTLGRIKRNPIRTLEYNATALKYYIYSRVPESRDNFIRYVINPKYKDKKEFPQIRIKNPQHVIITPEELLTKTKDLLIKKQGRIVEIYHNDFLKKKRLAIEISNVNNLKRVYYITNCFQFKEYVLNLCQKYNNLFKTLSDLIIEQFENFKIKNPKITKYHYYFVLFSDKYEIRDEIFTIYNTSKTVIKNSVTYELKKTALPSSFIESNDPSEKKPFENYNPSLKQLFYYPDTKIPSKKKILFDSNSERIIFDEIKDILKNHNDVDFINWGKNPGKIVDNHLFFEYLDKESTIKKAFTDFILKIKNKFLLIEVKNKKDIDPLKTETLKSAMADYFNKGIDEKNLFFTVLSVNKIRYDIDEIHCKDEKLYRHLNNPPEEKTLEKIINKILYYS